MKCSTAGEKTPTETIIPSKVNNKKPIEANAIFISLVFIREINDMILINVDKPRNDSRRNISNSFIYQAFSFSISSVSYKFF
jgi:DNA transposition AAA+ family ATPase